MAGKKDVLKLVHPGRFIETHTEPIPAYEVLNKYPRHCITRPDVFKCPWIVVKPESLLLPGKVFFLVPKRTVYYLMKASPHQQRPSSPPSPCLSSSIPPNCSETNVHWHGNSPTKSLARMTPKHRSHGQSMLKSAYWNFRKTTEQENTRKHYQSYSELESSQIAEDTKFSKDHSSNWTSGVQKRNESRDKEGDGSRSCLRKRDSSRRFLNLRVTFDFDYQRT